MNKRIRILVNISVLTALIAAATMFLKLPLPMDKGYCNLGDGLILASGVLLGPWTAIAAAAGSALADILLGYAYYAPATAVIKGLMGLIAGAVCLKQKNPWRRCALFIGAECLMIGGYFLFETALYGLAGAAASLLGNGCQGVAGAGAAMMLWPVMERIRKTIH